MVWPFKNKRKKEVKQEEIPELPELPPLPDLDSKFTPKQDKTKIEDELPPLPTFTKTPVKEKPDFELKPTIEEPPIEVKLQKIPRTRELEKEEIKINTSYKPIVKEVSPSIKTEPIFVRIDKYQRALSQFQEIKKRITQIDNLLRNIKEMRTKEEAELEQWEQEIQDAKSKLNNIDKTIFNKLE
tara:strand:+ start:667 stop:1218 length:552 start_codon:yes stop_codon:yes gene_type:complete